MTQRPTWIGYIGHAGPMMYIHVMRHGEHWTRLLSGFTSRTQARDYLEKTYPGVELLCAEEFEKRSKEWMRELGRRAGMVAKEASQEEVLPEGDVASISGQGSLYMLVLLKGATLRTISGMSTAEEAEKLWEGLYTTYHLVAHDLFEKIKKKRGIL